MPHNSYTMSTRDLPDMYTLNPWASGVHIRQTTRVHGITITYLTTLLIQYIWHDCILPQEKHGAFSIFQVSKSQNSKLKKNLAVKPRRWIWRLMVNLRKFYPPKFLAYKS